MEYLPRFLTAGNDHFFLLGPRGTGKTLWCSREFPDALRIDLLDPANVRRYSAQPERLRDLVDAQPTTRQIVIDEIQKLPELLEVVHQLIDRRAGQQFILTGSSARKLRRGGVNLLGGRAAEKQMHPYMAAEIGERFSLDHALRYGMLPVVWAAHDADAILNAYNGLYLREEVQMEGFVRNIGSFARFLEALSFSQGSSLNLAAVARDCQVNRKTVEGYLEVLEDLLLGFRINVFSRRAKRATTSHPKFYYFDAGVYRANRPAGPLDSSAEIDGAALEGLVAQHLRSWCAYTRERHDMYFWQTREGTEIDFVIYGASGLYALEVKNSARIRPEDLRPLRSFGSDYPEARRLFLYRGPERLVIDGVLCMPCEEFLRALRPGQIPT